MSMSLATPTLPSPWVRTARRSPTILSAGIVAHNEERHLERAVRSLLDQDLPNGVWWNTLWIVASGCTDRTVEVAERLTEEDPRVRLVVEPQRWGKAHALREIFRRAHGTALVLLNADASAEPGSVSELVRVASHHPPPFAVMGRPVVPADAPGRWAGMLRSMWELHHEFHLELQDRGGGEHLSDELLLVGLPSLPPLPDGIINDGSYFGVWLAQRGGRRLYAPQARVHIEIPTRMRDHLRQRRRIQFGNDQVAQVLGDAPSTLARYALHEPRRAFHLLRASVVSRPNGTWRLAQLGAAELVAKALSAWDRIPPRKDHVRWRRIGGTPALSPPDPVLNPPPPSARSTVDDPLEPRVTALLETARRFGTGLPLGTLIELLPRNAPATVEEMRCWFDARPDIGRIEGDRVFSLEGRSTSAEDRQARGIAYRSLAREVVDRRLGRALPLVRCLGITGSTAYGEPERGDDVDFLVVTRSGATWLFLAYTYFTLRFGPRAVHGPDLCFNFVLDDFEAPREFAGGRGFLFAREALTAGILWGEEYYRHLLASAPWMVEELPRLFNRRVAAEEPRPPRCLSMSLRCLNALIFPVLAAYLQLAGLRRNHRLHREGRDDAVFRTVVGLRRLAFVSRRFERLRRECETPQLDDVASGGPMSFKRPTER
jgi:glycosyltransferase involved in cell wall biosynthesis